MENKKILVVEVIEDETSLRNALHDKLSEEGFSVLGAKNGKEGLEMALKEHPDLILLDVVMPVMDGLTMLDKLRHDEWGTEVPVILLTNLPDKEDEAIRSPFGSLDYIIKSDWKLEDVVKKIREKLKS